MSANPIGLIIAAILALIAVTVIIVRKWDEWGAAAALLLGPFGLLLNMVMSIRRHWDRITEAFTTGGFVAGIKAIGVALIDSFLIPLEQILMLIAKIPSLSGLAETGLNAIETIRENIGAGEGATEGAPVVNTAVATEEQRIIRESNNNTTNTLGININGTNGAAEIDDSDLGEGVTLTTTLDNV